MGAVKLLAAVLMVASCKSVSARGNCYAYYDYAAKYNLDHVATSYPWDEVKYMMSQNPQLSQVFPQGTTVPTSGSPNAHHYIPVSVVCPSQRFMLKAFHVDGKQCYVIRPEIQQVRYSRCIDLNNRDCHYCSHNGGISKCEEDYEWQKVWAYCRPIFLKPQPNPFPYPRPTLVNPQPNPYPQPYPQPRPAYPPQSRPAYYPKLQPKPSQYRPTKLYAKPTNYYDPWGQQNKSGRWKRSVKYYGKVELISLYLPFQCTCKNYRC